jgi:glutamate dehydrogenase/leucine dehydrogenase
VLDQTSIPLINAPIVCGAANNQLAHDGLADDLKALGITYAPDFVVNAGGIINISVEFDPGGYDPDAGTRKVRAIGETMTRLLKDAEANGTTPLAAAYALAQENLADAKTV